MRGPYISLLTRRSSTKSLARASAALASVGLGSSAYYYFSCRRTVHLDAGELSGNEHDTLPSGDAETKLRQPERFLEFNPETGIKSSYSTALASNPILEDVIQVTVSSDPETHWSFFSVFDGHNGHTTSTWLGENLSLAVRGSLADLYNRVKYVSAHENPTVQDIETTLKQTFKDVDDVLVNEAAERALTAPSRDEAIALLGTAYSGSCATLGFYDSHTRLLHVAATGDSRAVLGRRINHTDGSGHHYEVCELSVDQNGSNPAEASRLLSQHPGEHVVQNGRVLGWGVSRAFGNGTYKWDLDTQRRLAEKELVRPPPARVKTPPYLTAEPEVTSTKIEPGDFMILASDGLWEWLTCEDAVGLVGWWLDSRADDPRARAPAGPVSPKELPVKGDHDPEAVRVRTAGREPRFVNVDANVATHLVRNALGGADDALRAKLLSKKAPESRRYRDDISTIVVFFV